MTMQSRTISLLLAALLGLIVTHNCYAAQDGAWQEDLRRCMIYKPIEGGRVVIANNEGTLEIDVQREGTADEGTDGQEYLVDFDNGMAVSTRPTNASAGIYDNELGSYATIAPVFAKARSIMISITGGNAPAQSITVPVGNGQKAMAFLKKCDEYWRRYHSRHR
jgi:hypothetical protein